MLHIELLTWEGIWIQTSAAKHSEGSSNGMAVKVTRLNSFIFLYAGTLKICLSSSNEISNS